MALTEKQEQAKAEVAAWQAAGFPPHAKHDGKQSAIHTEWVYLWLGEAVFELGLSWPDGSGQYHVDDRLRYEASETWWGQGLRNLHDTDHAVPSGAGWRRLPGFGARALWWDMRRHEAACNGLPVYREGYPVPQFAARVDNLFSPAAPAPTEAEWLGRCSSSLHPADYAALRSHLGLPAEEPPPQPQPEPEPEPQPEPEPPPPSGTLREKLREAEQMSKDAVLYAEAARTQADAALNYIRAALSELGGE